MKRSNSERNFPVVFRLEGSSFIFCAKRLQSDFHFCKIKINHFDCGNRFNIQAKAPSCQENPYAFHPTKKSTSAKGAVALARLFNAQQPDVAGISVQTAHKWLTGRAIPAYEKMRALAECLDIDFQWLRDGVYPVRL